MQRFALIAAFAAFVTPVYAVPVDELLGTWECRAPGAAPTNTPPIVWFGPAQGEAKIIQAAVDLDGFARTLSGLAELAPESDGWWKVQTEDGQLITVKPLGTAGKQSAPAMLIKRGAESYRCLRLPQLVRTSEPPAFESVTSD
jgi:hypothetical protein